MKLLKQEDGEETMPVDTTPNMTPPTPIQSQQNVPQVTPSTSTRMASRVQANMPSSGYQTPTTTRTHSASPLSTQSTNSLSSDTSNPTLASLRRQKFKSIREIYQQDRDENDTGLNSLFALYSHVNDPIHFEEAIKNEKWMNVMDEEIDAIKKNET